VEDYLEDPYQSNRISLTDALIVHDKAKFRLEKYMPDNYLYWLGTWVTFQDWNPKYPNAEDPDYDPDDMDYTNIDTPEKLAWLISMVNGENGATANDFAGETIYIKDDISMDGHIWVPIGTDLHPFKGTGSIAIRHYNVPDHSWLHIDNIEVTNAEGESVYFEDFENSRGHIPAQLSSIDHDGDGYGWEVLSNKPEDQWVPYDESGVYGISSTTWKKDGRELHPDDWLIISDVELGGTFSFMGLAQRIDETDNFAVYVMADDYVKEVPISNSNSYYMSRLLNNVPYSWQIKSVRGTEESRWASALFETPYDPYAIATGIQSIDNGKLTKYNYTDKWYTIEGQKLSGKPTKKGVYIYNGKRVVN
jgi:hypothetical protein